MIKSISTAEIAKLGIGFMIGYFAYKLVSYAGSRGQTRSDPVPLIETPSDQIKKQQQQIAKQLHSLNEIRDLLAHKSAKFQIQNVQGYDTILSKKCLLDFISQTEGILDYKQLVQINLQSRKARRQIISDISSKYQTYFKFVCTLDQSIKYVLEKAQKDFSVFLNLDYNVVMNSIDYHIDNEPNQDVANQFRVRIVEIMTTLRESQGNYMPLFSSPVSKTKLIQILKFQTKLLQKQEEHIVQLVKKMGLQTKQEQQALPLFLTCYIEDVTWQHFGVESEQMSIQDQDMDGKIKQSFQNFKTIRDQLIAKLHFSIQDDIIIQ